eukprot:TRINITY_DN16489_c0_g1_i1.p2 TRINITY_DN16489_c0_g1~~TRINITY_DN16489_c0_g1_i1.p2  ORF type:complete len:153 (-),score=52.85 TRINITY_DN16489_c0_g1_i1:57-515(-)
MFFFSSRRRHTRCREVSWARRCVQETEMNIAQALFQLKRYNETIQETTELIDNMDGRNAKAYYRRGCVKYQMGEYREAYSDLKIAKELDPKDEAIDSVLRQFHLNNPTKKFIEENDKNQEGQNARARISKSFIAFSIIGVLASMIILSLIHI